MENKLTANNPTIEGYITGNNDTISTIVSNVVGTTEVKVPVVKNIVLLEPGSNFLSADAYISFLGSVSVNLVIWDTDPATGQPYQKCVMEVPYKSGQLGPFPKYTSIQQIEGGSSPYNRTYAMYT